MPLAVSFWARQDGQFICDGRGGDGTTARTHDSAPVARALFTACDC
jgi:hypothetical protein